MSSLEQCKQSRLSELKYQDKAEYEKSLAAECIRRLQTAAENAINLDDATDNHIIQRYADLCLASLMPEAHRPADFDAGELEKMDDRMMRAIAQVSTLAEFRVLLECLPEVPAQWIENTIAHENAHMNVSEQKTDTTQPVGYGVMLMMKDGHIDSVVPLHLARRKEGSHVVQFLEDQILITGAPDAYGERTSEDDKYEIEKTKWVLSLHKEEAEKRQIKI